MHTAPRVCPVHHSINFPSERKFGDPFAKRGKGFLKGHLFVFRGRCFVERRWVDFDHWAGNLAESRAGGPEGR